MKTIKTVWPCAFEDYIDGKATRATYSSISSLRVSPVDQTMMASVYNNVFAFRAKSIVMLHQAITLGSPHPDRHGDQIHDVRVAIDVTSHLSEAMAAYRQMICPTFSRTRNYEDDGHDGTLIFAISTAYAALLRLFNLFADKDADAYRRRLTTARACIALGNEAFLADPILIHALLVLPWCASYEVLAWEMIRLNRLGEAEAATAVRAEVEAVMGLLRFSVQSFDTFKQKWPLQNLRRFNIHTEELLNWMV